jgi:competence/damage-inducible protein CinA-like protein
MRAEIITIGDELLIGQVLDTNSTHISSMLDEIGVKTVRRQSIGDNCDEIKTALNLAKKNSSIIIITGGLGPTADDKTRDCLCEYFHDELVLNKDVLADIEHMLGLRSMTMTPRNADQAMVPSKSIAIRNTKGTAPGMYFSDETHVIVSLPGVPYEMEAMMKKFVLPELAKSYPVKSHLHRVVTTIGVSESGLADTLKDWENSLPDDVSLAYLPGAGMVKLRLSCYRADSQTEALMNKLVESLDPLIGKSVFTVNGETMEQVIARMLLSTHQNVAVAESCTGGSIAQLLTSVPGSSQWFRGGVVAYAENIKVAVLGVDENIIKTHGVVSEEVAISMASCAMNKFKSDWAISATGVAGPGGDSQKNPVGTVWAGIAGPGISYARKFNFFHNRARNISLATLFVVNELRKSMLKIK